MLKPTHRALATTTAVGVAVVTTPPIIAAISFVAVARTCAMLPDKMEKWFFVGQDNHRTWTHWLITCIISGICLGLIVYGIGYGASEIAESRMCLKGRCDSNARDVVTSIYQFGIIGAYLVGAGAIIGAVIHSLADACTLSGVPLFGPFTKRKFWLMPEGMRTRTGEIKTTLLRGKPKPFQMTAGERNWLLGSYIAMALLLFLHFAPYLRDMHGAF